MITQIYSMQTPEEALACIGAGADYLGLLTGDDQCPAAITPERAREIFQAVGDRAVKVAILMYRDENKVIAAARKIHPDIVHLCDDKVLATPEFAARLRAALPGIKLMQAIGVGFHNRDEALENARKYERTCDYLILDTVVEVNAYGATTGGIGAAGVPHDWNIDREIVETVSIPVIVAGGLWGENVADAIRAIRPFGVDTLSKTTVIENGVYLRKDIDKVRAFCKNAKEAAAQL